MPDVDFEYFPLFLSTLFLRQHLLLNLKLTIGGRLAGQQATRICGFHSHSQAVLRLQECSSCLLLCGFWDPNLGSHACPAYTLSTTQLLHILFLAISIFRFSLSFGLSVSFYTTLLGDLYQEEYVSHCY